MLVFSESTQAISIFIAQRSAWLKAYYPQKPCNDYLFIVFNTVCQVCKAAGNSVAIVFREPSTIAERLSGRCTDCRF